MRYIAAGSLVLMVLLLTAASASATPSPPALTQPAQNQIVGKTLTLGATAGMDVVRVDYFVAGAPGPVASGTAPDFTAVIPDITAPPISASPSGVYDLYAVAFDAANTPSLASYPMRHIGVDTTTNVRLAGPLTTPQRTADVELGAVNTDPDATCIQWRVDSSSPADWTDCQDPGTTGSATIPVGGFSVAAAGTRLTLLGPPEGSHVVSVRVRDALLNEATATGTVVIDRTPPALAITVGPPEGSTIRAGGTTFGFVAETGATMLCAWDEPISYLLCGTQSSDHTGGLTDGSHAFTVRAVDAAGNASELVRNFRVALPPVTDDSTDAAGFAPSSTGIIPSTSRKRVGARISLKTTRGSPRNKTLRPVRKPYLTVTKTKNATRITITCNAPKGRRAACPFKTKRYTVTDGRKKIGKAWARRRLPTGTTITIRVTGPNAIGRAVKYTVRSYRQSPRRQIYCLRAGSTVLRRGC